MGATVSWRSALAAISIAVLAACDAPAVPEVDGGDRGDGSHDASTPDPRALFTDEVAPLLALRCEECHQGGVRAPEFLAAGDYEASVLAYPSLVVPGEPDASLILQKGAHRGPAWSADEALTIARWILALAP